MSDTPPDQKTAMKTGQGALDNNLQGEIRMLRSAMQRVFELGQVEQDPEFTLKVLRTLSIASGKLAGLLRSQQQIAGAEDNEATAAISQALRELMDEWGLK
jgi:hypothetical protein